MVLAALSVPGEGTLRRLRMVPVDACTDCVCSGNPAAVLILTQPLADGLMQAIAAGNRMADQPRCCCGGWPEG